MRKAANVIRDRARNNAARVDDPLTKEAIYKNIVVTFSSKTFRRTGDPTFRVGIMGLKAIRQYKGQCQKGQGR